jgi:2-polyprenyl-3-methyl-5-hydroxy-6-metoxy-1,4-benzoquinol methylase
MSISEQHNTPEITWPDSFLDTVLSFVPLGVKSVLDVGCGRGIVGAMVKIYRDPPKLVGLDIYDPYINFCRKLGTYDTIVKHNLQEFPYPFSNSAFDIVIGLEVIEHLPKSLAVKMLGELERISSQRVIISTPNIFIKQPLFDNDPYQAHASLISIKNFKDRGYTVFGVGNFKIGRFRPKYFRWLLSRTTLLFPTFADELLAIKDRDKKSRLDYIKKLSS